MNFKITMVLIFACLVVIFVIQNVAAVTLNIFFWEITLSLALLIFFILAIGFIIGWLLHSFLSYRKVKQEVSKIQTDLRTDK